MKKLIALFVAILATGSVAFSQVKVSTESPDMDVQVRRAFARGENVFVDLTISCHKPWEFVSLYTCVVYDDEGNRYNSSSFDLYNENGDYRAVVGGSAHVYVGRDIPRKVRIRLNKVDEYATVLSLFEIEWQIEYDIHSRFKTTIKNLPISRN